MRDGGILNSSEWLVGDKADIYLEVASSRLVAGNPEDCC